MALWGTVDETGDPDAFMMIPWDSSNARAGGSNVCYYRNFSVHSLLWNARELSGDNPSRSAQYRKVQEYLHNDVPMVPLTHSSQVIAVHRKVRNFKAHPSGLYDLSAIWLEK
jgi:peptide/nickel transport system substrate-binding protein